MKNKRTVYLLIGLLAICLICAVIAILLPDATPTEPPEIFTQAAQTIAAPTSTPELPTVTPTLQEDSAQYWVDAYGGAIEAYEEILEMTDCTALQEKFDIAASNNEREQPGAPAYRWTLGFMMASDYRMKSIGCY